MTTKEIFGVISIILTIASYAPYFWSIYKKRTKPHLFSWIVWGLVNSIAFVAQVSKGAGPGAWVTGFTAALCLLIAILAIRLGDKEITNGDWASFLAALVAIPLWYFTRDPLATVMLAAAIDVLGCYPTLRKSYARPHEESAFTWGLAALRSLLSVFALETYSLVTAFYPLALTLINSGVVYVLLMRRAALRKLKE